eukprot:TRINITY_DN70679_c0_g1_i1.p1 TRINITY_DN70679_c0_g1~~TRINITY_DN70679_c0_g1_i1.p1  ORF type:complete len:219 (+),score=43.29 TRINITY_DN70679_c0_g1_i1:106-762(+)
MNWLHCCCVSNNRADHLAFLGDQYNNSATGSEANHPSESSAPRLPVRRASPRPDEDDFSRCGLEEPPTARSAASRGSMSLEEKEHEKARLQKLVKDFAREAITGIAVSVIHPETAIRSAHFFQMDRYLTVFSLKPKDGSTADASVQDFNVRDLTSIYKGVEVLARAPTLGKAAAACVGLDTNRADRRIFFHFDDGYERDKLYTCLKILRMSVDVGRYD